jgi:hypothetical protein
VDSHDDVYVTDDSNQALKLPAGSTGAQEDSRSARVSARVFKNTDEANKADRKRNGPIVCSEAGCRFTARTRIPGSKCEMHFREFRHQVAQRHGAIGTDRLRLGKQIVLLAANINLVTRDTVGQCWPHVSRCRDRLFRCCLLGDPNRTLNSAA